MISARLLRGVPIEVEADDGRALARKLHRAGLAISPPRAGASRSHDERDFVLQPFHRLSTFR